MLNKVGATIFMIGLLMSLVGSPLIVFFDTNLLHFVLWFGATTALHGLLITAFVIQPLESLRLKVWICGIIPVLLGDLFLAVMGDLSSPSGVIPTGLVLIAVGTILVGIWGVKKHTPS